MRIVTSFGLAVAMVASWCAPLPAQADEPFGGPRSIKFDEHGVLSPTLSGSIDLIAGTADLVGPCGPGFKDGSPCGPLNQRHLALSSPDIAKLRSMAIKVRDDGLFDTVCIERQRKEAELADLRQKMEAEKKRVLWMREHPGDKFAPNFAAFFQPPYDPSSAILTIEGVGTVVSAPQEGNRKSDAGCMMPATQTLWNMVLNPWHPIEGG